MVAVHVNGRASVFQWLGGLAFSGQSLAVFLCCGLSVQVLVVDLFRGFVAES